MMIVAGLGLGLVGCQRKHPSGPPPRATDRIVFKDEPSLVTVPVHADLGGLVTTLEQEVPRTLWTVDKPDQVCVPSRKVDIGIAKVKTPTLKCRIVGEVTRGGLTLEGQGQEIILAMPIHAVIRAEDIGGILKRETATADAIAHARVKLNVRPDWNLTGKIDISYHWTSQPHVDFLGKRIDLTDKADEKLKPVIARLERTLPAQLAKLELRRQVEKAWREGYTTVQLNRRNPPVWMQVQPLELQYGGYEVYGRNLVLRLGLKAVTRTKVGDRPPEPAPRPLPRMRHLEGDVGRLAFFLPVIADYKELEPVLMEALAKRAKRPFQVPGVGPLMASFRSAEIYGTRGGRIAVGLDITTHDPSGRLDDTKGRVWLTAKPYNATNSRRVKFRNLEVSGNTDGMAGDLALQLANTDALSGTLSEALGQNFEDDFDELLGKIARAIDEKREGDLLIRAKITETQTGRIRAAGEGLFLPVHAKGHVTLSVAP